MVEREAFLANQSHNIVHSIEENMIVVLITKKMENIMCAQGCLFSLMTFDYKENRGKKAFLANPMHQYHVSQSGEHDCHANNKKNGCYYEYPTLSHFSDEL